MGNQHKYNKRFMMVQNGTEKVAEFFTKIIHNSVLPCPGPSDFKGNLFSATLFWLLVAIEMTASTTTISTLKRFSDHSCKAKERTSENLEHSVVEHGRC